MTTTKTEATLSGELFWVLAAILGVISAPFWVLFVWLYRDPDPKGFDILALICALPFSIGAAFATRKAWKLFGGHKNRIRYLAIPVVPALLVAGCTQMEWLS